MFNMYIRKSTYKIAHNAVPIILMREYLVINTVYIHVIYKKLKMNLIKLEN